MMDGARRTDLPIHLKFGYDHMIEMRRIEDGLRAEGLSGTDLYFTAIRRYSDRHKHDLPLRLRQQVARENGEAWAGGSQPLPSDTDLLRAALEAIRDGHNNARELAAEVLEQITLPPHGG